MRLQGIVILEQQIFTIFIFTIIEVSIFYKAKKKKKKKRLGLTTIENKFIVKMLQHHVVVTIFSQLPRS